ncbi:hypothetical protein TNCV_1786371 [Trichonephila clavipes]|nr:hypothetical protein TNCV_1786371 [Trichonephila clavipes]
MLKLNRVLADQSYEEMATSRNRNCPMQNKSRMSKIGRNGICFVDGERIFFGDSIFVKAVTGSRKEIWVALTPSKTEHPHSKINKNTFYHPFDVALHRASRKITEFYSFGWGQQPTLTPSFRVGAERSKKEWEDHPPSCARPSQTVWHCLSRVPLSAPRDFGPIGVPFFLFTTGNHCSHCLRRCLGMTKSCVIIWYL